VTRRGVTRREREAVLAQRNHHATLISLHPPTRCGSNEFMKSSRDQAGATLLLASLSLPSARQLAQLVTARRWRVHALDETPDVHVGGRRTFYGGTDRAAAYAERFRLALLEPPLDLLARAPAALLARDVRYGTLAELAQLRGPVFVKPADPVLRTFDAGVYRSVADVRGRRPLDGRTPVLVSEPVEWTSELRCFVRDGRVAAWSPYLSFGRPVWKPGCATAAAPASLWAFCERLVDAMRGALPPAFVVDVGVLADGRWAAVEFNPAWCSGVLGADAAGVLRVVERAALGAESATREDRRWVRLAPPSSVATHEHG
jgi:hypothetical protein